MSFAEYQAGDTELIELATEIKVRAERRAGQMLKDMAENGERATREKSQRTDLNHVEPCDKVPTLSDLNISRDQSSHNQKLAAMREEDFEAAVARAKMVSGEVTTAFLLGQQGKKDSQPARRIVIRALWRVERAESDSAFT